MWAENSSWVPGFSASGRPPSSFHPSAFAGGLKRNWRGLSRTTVKKPLSFPPRRARNSRPRKRLPPRAEEADRAFCYTPCMSLLRALADSKRFLLNVEVCPTRMDLPLEQSVEAWIDSNQLMRKITSLGRFVFRTDCPLGRWGEPNLRHVTINLGPE